MKLVDAGKKSSAVYPMKIKCGKRFLEELLGCESGRHEDAEGAREAGDIESIEGNDYETVFCDFGWRHSTQVELRNDEELVEYYYALASGTIGLYACRAANTQLDKIREYVLEVSPRTVKIWPCQNGY